MDEGTVSKEVKTKDIRINKNLLYISCVLGIVLELASRGRNWKSLIAPVLKQFGAMTTSTLIWGSRIGER